MKDGELLVGLLIYPLDVFFVGVKVSLTTCYKKVGCLIVEH